MYNALVVDDNPISLRVVENLIAGYQINVTSVTGGRDALEKITSMEYDIVFMDHLMPGMDGIETLHSIRNMPGEYYRKVPVVALTANEISGAREHFLAEGFQAFLSKPVKPDQLKSVINEFLFQENTLSGADEHVTEEITKDAAEEWDSILVAYGLDVKTALLYCNGKESYLDILREYCRIENEILSGLEQAFSSGDWEGYTIAVHGIKSAMRSIGATELSEGAKHLETAGREGRIEYISEHHKAFLIQYKNLFLKLKDNILLGKSEDEKIARENRSELSVETEDSFKELAEDDFIRLIDDMEEAAYSLDVDCFLEYFNSLKQCRYRGIVLRDLSELLQRKIQRADFLSAVGAIKQWKQRCEENR